MQIVSPGFRLRTSMCILREAGDGTFRHARARARIVPEGLILVDSNGIESIIEKTNVRA